MTEEIIIDDIDVSECERHCSDNLNNPNMCYSDMTETYSNCNPKEKQCYFYITSIEKQLKRAEQKLDKIKANCNETLSECSCKNPIIDIDCRECTSGGRVEKAKEILQIIEGNENE